MYLREGMAKFSLSSCGGLILSSNSLRYQRQTMAYSSQKRKSIDLLPSCGAPNGFISTILIFTRVMPLPLELDYFVIAWCGRVITMSFSLA